MKPHLLKIMSAVLAAAMVMCCFAACGKTEEDHAPGVTKPSEIAGPDNQDELVDFDEINIGVPSDTSASQSSSSAADKSTKPSTKPAPRPTNPKPSGSVNTTNPKPGNTDEGQSNNPEIEAMLRAFGYEYDKEQDIYYSTINPWQRQFGFGELYDWAAKYVNMRYNTIKIDFNYGDYKWRIQCWKGNYGVLCGGEMGVYLKDPNSNSTDFYECALEENFLEMHFKYYRTPQDFNAKKPTFERELQEHWWLTGFKFGSCNPQHCVMEMTLNAKDSTMADAIEQGLINVKDNSGRPNGFTKFYGANAADVYIREGNSFRILWFHAGFLNY